jgi:hypothetical protein
MDQKPLDDMNPADISMAVLDQMPSIIRKHTKNKCIFSSDLLSLHVDDITDKLVLAQMANESEKFMVNRLLKHLVFLKRFAFLEIRFLSETFGPCLIAANATSQQDKAVRVLEKILNIVVAANSSGNYQLNMSNSLNNSKSLTETSINQELLLASNSKLKDSNIYQDFINSTASSNKSKQLRFADDKKKVYKRVEDDDDDDDNDDIDALLAPKSLASTANSNANYKTAKPVGPTAFANKSKSPRSKIKIQNSFYILKKNHKNKIIF